MSLKRNENGGRYWARTNGLLGVNVITKTITLRNQRINNTNEKKTSGTFGRLPCRI